MTWHIPRAYARRIYQEKLYCSMIVTSNQVTKKFCKNAILCLIRQYSEKCTLRKCLSKGVTLEDLLHNLTQNLEEEVNL